MENPSPASWPSGRDEVSRPSMFTVCLLPDLENKERLLGRPPGVHRGPPALAPSLPSLPLQAQAAQLPGMGASWWPAALLHP